jgi:hypothetical protein
VGQGRPVIAMNEQRDDGGMDHRGEGGDEEKSANLK